MKLNEILKAGHIVPAIWPVDFDTAANPGDFVSMKDYAYGLVVIQIGVTTGTAVVTMDKAALVAGGTTTLAFTKYYRTGMKLPITGASGDFTIGETVTGTTSAEEGYVAIDGGGYLYLHTVGSTGWTDGETVTGGTSGVTCTVDGSATEEDVLLEATATSDTFTIPAVSNRTYAIPIDADSLGDGYTAMQLDVASASAGCIGSAFYALFQGRYNKYPMPSAIYD